MYIIYTCMYMYMYMCSCVHVKTCTICISNAYGISRARCFVCVGY